MITFYRYSDKGHNPIDSGWDITRKDCLLNFYKRFKNHKIVIICDNCQRESINYLKSFSSEKIVETTLGPHAGFLWSLQYALDNYPDEEAYYFAEDDYMYSGENCYELLLEGLIKADYCTLYDHPDKYPDYHCAPNPLLREDGERSLVFRTDSIHWKTTNSLCYTFAVKRTTLSNDLHVFNRYVLDFPVFTALKEQGRVIASCIPGRASHVAAGSSIPTIDLAKQYESPFFKYEMPY